MSAASVWITLSIIRNVLPERAGSERPSAEMTPAVTDPAKPCGLPIANSLERSGLPLGPVRLVSTLLVSTILSMPGIRLDIDNPEDLALLLRQKPRPTHAWNYLVAAGLVEQHDRAKVPQS